MPDNAMAPVPADHPMMIAWNQYKGMPGFANSRNWALKPEHVDGSLWAAFEAGWQSASNKVVCSWCGHETPKDLDRAKFIEAMSEHMLKCEKSPLFMFIVERGLIDELRAEEGASVEITCSNPEGTGPDNEQVIVTSDWTNWQPRAFRGQTVLLALADAAKEKSIKTAKPPAP